MGDDDLPVAVETKAEPVHPPAESGMSWWTRSWVTLGVLVAMGLTAAGILVVRHVLDHPADPRAAQQRVADRLTSLDPALPGFTASGNDVTATVSCAAAASCVSASREFRPAGKATEADLRDTVDAWASGFGLGSRPAADSDPVECGTSSAAPTAVVLCDLATYQVPGDESQHVHVFAQLTPDPKAPSVGGIGTFTRGQLAKLAVISVYVQVLGTVS
jgi:hypothetical protein